MKKMNGEKQSSLRLTIVAAAILVVAAAAAAVMTAPPAAFSRADEDDNDRRAAVIASGPLGIVAGQTAIIGVLNTGENDALARLQYVDNEGKILIQCNLVVGAGKTTYGPLKHPGGVNRVEFHAEVITNTKREIKALAASVQILDNETGETTLFVDSGGFAEFRALPNPPLITPSEPPLP